MNNAWKLILATVIIFGAGVVVGGLLVYHVIPAHPKSTRHAPVIVATTNRPPVPRSADLFNPRQPEILSTNFVQKLDDELQFTPAQQDAVHKIITCGQEQNHALWTNCTAQSRQVLLEVRQHIREQLNPEQLKQFEKILKQAHPAARRTSGTGTNAPPVLSSATNAPGI